MSYEWPNELVHELWLREAKGNKELAVRHHKEDLAEELAWSNASKKMEAEGFKVSPDGSWRNKRNESGQDVWVSLLFAERRAVKEVRT